MPIQPQDIWPTEKTEDYNIDFARYDADGGHTLDVWARDKSEWKEWQQYRPPKHDEFNRRFIFSMMQFHHETDTWLFGEGFAADGRDYCRSHFRFLNNC